MPRQTDTTGQSFAVATVEAPDVRIIGARVLIENGVASAHDQKGKFLRSFALDGEGQGDGELFTAMVGGLPFTVRWLDRCPCKGTQVVPK